MQTRKKQTAGFFSTLKTVMNMEKENICTVDIDIVVLAMFFFHILNTAGLQEMSILFGTGKDQKYMNINAIFGSMGEQSDETSFAMKGKVWKSLPEAAEPSKPSLSAATVYF